MMTMTMMMTMMRMMVVSDKDDDSHDGDDDYKGPFRDKNPYGKKFSGILQLSPGQVEALNPSEQLKPSKH